MNKVLEKGARNLLLCSIVLSTAVAPVSAAVWPSGGPNAVDSHLPAAKIPGDRCTTASGEIVGVEPTCASRPDGVAVSDRAAEGGFTPPEIEVSTDRIAFGSVGVGGPESASAMELLTIRNGGDTPLSVEETTIAGPNASAFEVVAGGGPVTLAPGDRRTVAVMFAPESAGPASAELRIESDDPDREVVAVELTGTGAGPNIEIRPETLRFENATDGPATETLTITNTGTVPLTVRELRPVGPDRSVFTPEDTGPFTVGPNQSRTVAVALDQTESRPRFAMMHVMSNDTDEPQRNVWLTNTPMEADVSPSTVLADRTIVNATVVNAQANTSQAINVSWPLTRDDAVAVDSLEVTPAREANFTINVTKSAERIEGTPPFDLSDGTEDAAFITTNSTIADEDLREVTVTFRVRKDQLTGDETGPEDVTLYTRQNGTWVELPTRLVDESRTHYFFEAQASGLTDFATGIKQAKFRIDDAVVSVTEIRTGDSVDVLVRVTNVGGADGTYDVELIRGDTVVDSRELSIAPNGTRQTTFTESFEEPGTYELYVNDRFVGNVTVNSPETTTNETAFRTTVSALGASEASPFQATRPRSNSR